MQVNRQPDCGVMHEQHGNSSLLDLCCNELVNALRTLCSSLSVLQLKLASGVIAMCMTIWENEGLDLVALYS